MSDLDLSGPLVLDAGELVKFTPKQREVYKLIGEKTRILAGGARGGGKTYMSVATAVLCCLMFPGLRVLVARRISHELEAQVIDNELLKRYYPGQLFTWQSTRKKAMFPNGSVIYFRSYEHANDVQNAQGLEAGLIILDEAGQFEESMIRRMTGSLRAFDQKGWRPTLILTANPLGVADAYFRDYFIMPRYDKWEAEERKYKDDYAFVPFGVFDNPHATEDYIGMLESQTEDVRRAWLYGDWTVLSGAFFSEWNPNLHVCDPFEIPEDWVRFRSVDLGYGTHPSVCLLAAQDPSTGIVYVYDEVATTDTTDVFIDLILQASGDDWFATTYFDPNSLKSRRGETGDTLSPATMFERAGIYVEGALNARMNGWLNVKAYMGNRPDSPSLLRVFPNCVGLIDTIPMQRYVEKKMDLNTRGQDDYVDALRYLLSHIPYGAMIQSDGSVSDTKDLSFGRDRERYRTLKQRGKDQDLIEVGGVYVPRYAVY